MLQEALLEGAFPRIRQKNTPMDKDIHAQLWYNGPIRRKRVERMAQAHGSALLKPMSADSLLRPDAARSMPATKKATPPPANGPSLMHPPTFAPRPARAVAGCIRRMA